MAFPSRLTRLAAIGCAASLLADGADRILFASLADGQWQVHSVLPDGSNRVQLTDDAGDKRGLRPIPGLPEVLYRNNEGLLFRLSARPASRPVPLLPGFEIIKDFDFHPTHGLLLSSYAANATDSIRIWWAAPDFSSKRLVVAEGKLNEMPRWHGSNALFFVRASRGQTRIGHARLDQASPADPFPNDPSLTTDPAPSPDSRHLAFCRDEGAGMDLWVAKPDGSNPRRIHAGAGLEAEPCWSPDGASICFTSWDQSHFRIARIRPDGTGFAWVTPPGMDCRTPAWISLTPTVGH